jgi:hypothetical protein
MKNKAARVPKRTWYDNFKTIIVCVTRGEINLTLQIIGMRH